MITNQQRDMINMLRAQLSTSERHNRIAALLNKLCTVPTIAVDAQGEARLDEQGITGYERDMLISYLAGTRHGLHVSAEIGYDRHMATLEEINEVITQLEAMDEKAES